ncbi:Polyadenylate-binding protein 4 [Bonamia ostreae]|uniref:Polyadenylate-binding protein 4 n=1 Tax=Bonamia ostreae TaxID=126728 RepID=A0ABV2ARI1_9EUKA
MSDSETKSKKIEPSEERSIYIRFGEDTKDDLLALVADYKEDAVIQGANFCILTYEDENKKNSEKAVIEQKLQGKSCTVADYKKSIRQIRAEESKRKVYVAEFGDEVTEENLRKAFEKYGTIDEVILLRSPAKDNKPYAFIKFEDVSSAEKAAEEGVELEGEKAVVEQSRPKRFTPRFRSTGAPLRNAVMIANYDASVPKESIRKQAEGNGEVVSFRFSKDHAIVAYKNPKMAEKAIANINGAKVNDKTLMAVAAPKSMLFGSSRFRGGRGRRGRGRRRNRRGGGENEKENAVNGNEAE